MMSTTTEMKTVSQVEEGKIQTDHADRVSNYDEKMLGADRAGAIEAENAEHNMGVVEAVRAYPMAALWAFIMSCTIVRFHPHNPFTLTICSSHLRKLSNHV